jgi:hypothetical protein
MQGEGMDHSQMQARLEQLLAEVEQLKQFADAAERGEHDDEAAIHSAASKLLPPEPERGFFGRAKPVEDNRVEQVRHIQRQTKMLQAYDRINKELYPEIHDLRFKLGLQ